MTDLAKTITVSLEIQQHLDYFFVDSKLFKDLVSRVKNVCKCSHLKSEHNYIPDYINTACIYFSCHCMEFTNES